MESQLGYRLFGAKYRKHPEKLYELQSKLRKARIPVSAEMYLATTKFYSIIGGIFGAALGWLIAYIWIFRIGLPKQLTKLHLPSELAWTVGYRELFIMIMLTLGLGLGLYFLSYSMLRWYPSLKASNRKSQIDKLIPYACTYMYALSRGGLNIVQIFQSISNAQDAYGEIAREFRSIVNEMEYLGSDLKSAMRSSMEASPSEEYKDFLHSMITVIDTGGSIPAFLAEKSRHYLDKAIQAQKSFLDLLGLMAEAYVTALVAGPLFLLVLMTMMHFMGTPQTLGIYAITYAMIPVGSIGFLMLLKILAPAEIGGVGKLELEYLKLEQSPAPSNPAEPEQAQLIQQLRKASARQQLKQALKDPLRPIKQDPYKSLYLAVPAGAGFLGYNILRNPAGFLAHPEQPVAFSLVIGLSVFAIFYEMKRRYEKKIRNEIPDLLHRLALTNEIGMTIAQSIAVMAKQEHGALTKEVRKLHKDMEWGLSLKDALARFANRLGIPQVSRTMKLLINALESTGDVKEVLEITAKDAATQRTLERERFSNMLIYVIIIHMSFIVFLGITLILAWKFIPIMAESLSKAAGIPILGGGVGYGRAAMADVEFFRKVLLHAGLMQGMFSGLMAGQMGEGRALAGLKHSLLMISMAIGAFGFLI